MDVNVVQLIQNFCEDMYNDDNQITFHADYSGRFMYGKKCIGISMEEANPYNVLILLTDYLHEHGITNVVDTIGSVTSDNLGMGTILYFPYLMVTKK